jgi:hypothetical protein
MDSFTSSAARPSTSFRVRNAQESDPEDNSYINSDTSSIISTNQQFKKPAKKDKYKHEKENKPDYIF